MDIRFTPHLKTYIEYVSIYIIKYLHQPLKAIVLFQILTSIKYIPDLTC